MSIDEEDVDGEHCENHNSKTIVKEGLTNVKNDLDI